MNVSPEIHIAESELSEVIDKFYAKMIIDDRIRDFFTIVDLEALKRKQHNLFRILICNESDNVKDHMRKAHKHLVEEFGLNDHHFDVTVEILKEALREQVTESDIRERIIGNFESLRPDVLNK